MVDQEIATEGYIRDPFPIEKSILSKPFYQTWSEYASQNYEQITFDQTATGTIYKVPTGYTLFITHASCFGSSTGLAGSIGIQIRDTTGAVSFANIVVTAFGANEGNNAELAFTSPIKIVSPNQVYAVVTNGTGRAVFWGFVINNTP